MRKSTESEILLRRRSRRCRRRRRHPSVTRTHSIDKKAEAEVFWAFRHLDSWHHLVYLLNINKSTDGLKNEPPQTPIIPSYLTYLSLE